MLGDHIRPAADAACSLYCSAVQCSAHSLCCVKASYSVRGLGCVYMCVRASVCVALGCTLIPRFTCMPPCAAHGVAWHATVQVHVVAPRSFALPLLLCQTQITLEWLNLHKQNKQRDNAASCCGFEGLTSAVAVLFYDQKSL